MNIWMLDHDPLVAARQHADEHVKQAPFRYAQILAYAWHDLHNSWYAPLTDDVEETPWFEHRSPIPAAYVSSKDRPRSAFPEESPYSWWLLFGQRVPSRRCDAAHPSETWVTQLGGNYNWLWRLAIETVAEYRYRFKRRHPAAPAIWTLEVVPFALEATLGEWSESPLDMPEHLKIAVDGFYDVVASNKQFYNIYPFTWTGRKPPSWRTPEEDETT